MTFGTIALEPFAGLAYLNLDSDGFTKRGGAAALRGTSRSDSLAFTTLGLHVGSRFNLGAATVLALRGTLGWRHAFCDVEPAVLMSFATGGGLPFAVSGAPIARDALVVDAGIELALNSAISLGLSYSGQFATAAKDNAVKGTLMWRF